MIKFSALPAIKVASFSLVFCLFIFSMAIQFSRAQAQPDTRTIECNPSNGSGGLAPGTYSDTTIAGQPAVVIVSENYDPSEPTVLTFYLHGDGGGYTFYSQDGRPLNDLVRNNGWIFVSPQSFTDAGSGTTRWWGAGVSGNAAGNAGIEANAQLLEDVFEEMFAKYNLCRNVLMGHSASGGSWFYDGYFVPSRGDRYPAFMNIGCGSSGIDSGWSFFPFYDNLNSFKDDNGIQNRTQLHYTIGDQDFLFDEAEDAVPHYQGLGFDVTTDFLTDVTHCAFDLAGKTIEYWTAVDNAITISTEPVASPTPEPTGTPTIAPTPTPTATPIPPEILDELIFLPMAVKGNG